MRNEALAQALDQPDATFARHAHISDHQGYVRVTGQLVQGHLHRGGGQAGEAFVFEQLRQFQQNVLLVIHQEDGCGGAHGSMLDGGQAFV